MNFKFTTQNYSNQDCEVLAIKNIHIDEENRILSPDIKALHLQSIDFQKGLQDNSMRKTVFLTSNAGTTGYPHIKACSWTPI